MARITVTTDDGEVIETWVDVDAADFNEDVNEIGDVHKPLNWSRMSDELREALGMARRRDGRNVATGNTLK